MSSTETLSESTLPTAVSTLVEEFQRRRPMRTKSLIVTVFGDVVSQHRRTIWLGSLVAALAPLGISERLVRTSVFRLVQEGWLTSQRAGRRSYYSYSDYGDKEYQQAARRIYALEEPPWDEQWHVLVPVDLPEEVREPFRRSLHWQGFRNIANNTYARPGLTGNALAEILEHFGVRGQVILMEASTSDLTPLKSVQQLVNDSWNLNDLAEGYTDFSARYKPLLKWLRSCSEIPEHAAFLARLLLIHDYRRLLLEDTLLPEVLLPAAWPGKQARELTAEAYRLLAKPSGRYISSALEGDRGKLPKPCGYFWSRFKPQDAKPQDSKS